MLKRFMLAIRSETDLVTAILWKFSWIDAAASPRIFAERALPPHARGRAAAEYARLVLRRVTSFEIGGHSVGPLTTNAGSMRRPLGCRFDHPRGR